MDNWIGGFWQDLELSGYSLGNSYALAFPTGNFFVRGLDDLTN
jgi:hypothetical protein